MDVVFIAAILLLFGLTSALVVAFEKLRHEK
jgi:hypothetical protein